MPLKSGLLTPGERIFAEVFASTGDALYAAEKAGFRNAAASASQLQRRDGVQAAISEHRSAELASLTFKSFKHCHKVLDDDKAPNKDKTAVAGLVFKEVKAVMADEGDAKELFELDGQQLGRRIAQLMAADAREVAEDIEPEPIEPEPIEAEAQAEQPEDGVFG